MINKLQLKAFYETHKDEYYQRRNSGNISQWDEGYKWDIFPKLNKLLAEYKTVTTESLPKIVSILKKHNPQQGSFSHGGRNCIIASAPPKGRQKPLKQTWIAHRS